MTAFVSMPRTFGVEPHPRALIMGFDEPTTKSLQQLFPTSRVIQKIDEVQPAEWDLLVTGKDPILIPDHLFVLAVAEEQQPRFGWAAPTAPDSLLRMVVYEGISHASQFTIPGGLRHRIDQLVEKQLLPVARSRASNITLRPPDALRPFLLTSDGGVLAGSFLRLGGKAECWCLPHYVDKPEAWVAAALEAWHDQDATRFPLIDWLRANEWRTAEENALAGRLELLRKKRDGLIQELKDQEEAILSALSDAERQADTTHRVLLTGQGRELVHGVTGALESFGFRITDMDRVWPQNNRREDLRATIEGQQGWTAIIEVRGYEKGAALNDLVRLHGRFRTMFLQETGRLPDRSWYVVNQFIRQPPGERPPVLSSQTRELEAYAEDGVLAIDTADLFRLRRAMENGRLSADQIRELLINAAGRLKVELIPSPDAAAVGLRSKGN